ncbi:hypothetical protein [Arthrobacter sp. ISL-69]|uniref:hypothetical protein n=1 Tax=Arthrobacter sp. ISL-69 TaxID=2819113 RepID=UPI001BE85B98|nr:hypothetical protein [Arthrobacter sp. ISL-69]MBT2537238.1 hypothetical protein [Arthrobacter sp. ISL-69]
MSGEKDPRIYITLTNEYPRHKKIRGLSDAAFRLHVTLITIANEDRSDGVVEPVDLLSKGPKPKKELLDAGLVEDHGGGRYVLHDYLKHQPSAKEIEERIEAKRRSGAVGGLKSAHKRHHLDKGVRNPDCELCQKS